MREQLVYNILVSALGYMEKDIPYVFGGELYNGDEGFDCSAFMKQIFSDNGVYLPRTSRTQATHGTKVSEDDMLPGDLIIFDRSGEGVADHVGMYLGAGLMIHTAKVPENINVCDWKERYGKHLLTIRRVV